MERTAITPGRLYALLSAEFRRMRPSHCGHCRMPMVVLAYRATSEDCNWTVEELGPLCEKCRTLVAAIVRDAAERYDLDDPVSIPHVPQSLASRRPGMHR